MGTKQGRNQVQIKRPSNAAETCGFVVLEFLIDSTGNVYSPTILEAEPEGVLDYAALKSLSLTKYDPAETNPDKTPVKVTQRTTFKSGDVDCE